MWDHATYPLNFFTYLYLVPEIKSTSDCNHREEDTCHDQEADLYVSEQEECEEEDTNEAEPHVAIQFFSNDPVSLPRYVHCAVGECVRRKAGVLRLYILYIAKLRL